MKADTETLRTSWTMVAQLKHPEHQESWRSLFELYRRLILGVALKAGLREHEAEDVFQETMVAVARHIGEFEADPRRGSFRAWLLNMARWRIRDQYRKRLPAGAGGLTAAETSSGTSAMEKIADPNKLDLESLCDAEWEKQLREQALQQLQVEVKAEHYQIFYLLLVEQKPVAEVARMVGRNRAQLYLIKHRVASALKKILRRLEQTME